jgi:hypothetical protein
MFGRDSGFRRDAGAPFVSAPSAPMSRNDTAMIEPPVGRNAASLWFRTEKACGGIFPVLVSVALLTKT